MIVLMVIIVTKKDAMLIHTRASYLLASILLVPTMDSADSTELSITGIHSLTFHSKLLETKALNSILLPFLPSPGTSEDSQGYPPK